MLFPIIKKELLLASRDVHALAVLFLMPMAFIFIMSLSLQDTFDEKPDKIIKIGFIFENPGDKSTDIGTKLITQPSLNTILYAPGISIKETMTKDALSAMAVLPNNFIQHLTNTALEKDPHTNKNLINSSENLIQLYYSPTAPQYVRKLIYRSMSQIIAGIQIGKILRGAKLKIDPKIFLKEQFSGNKAIHEHEVFGKRSVKPNAVEQTVPAWLIFSMFFVVIPISTTFIIEKQCGTLQRLRTMPVPSIYILVGKLIPYLFINLGQTLLMFLVGIYMLPIVGGQGLTLGDNAWLLVPMTFSVSVLAISFALFVATLVKTTEQATTIGGLSNIIFAAIGGIMVPTFVMPEMMRSFARLSPMNWGLEGFLEIILREGNFADIIPFMIHLNVAAMIFFSMALLLYRRTWKQQ